MSESISTANTSSSGSTSSSSSSSQLFASGTKAVKVILSRASGGSFTLPAALPSPTVIPANYPGYDGSTTYAAGIAASQFYDVDGTTAIQRPPWLHAVEVGVTSVSTGVGCAKFGDSGSSLDVNDYFRVDEASCGGAITGAGITSGTSADPVYVRVILNRDHSVLGSAENLLIQLEYQASGIRFNSDGSSVDPEKNLDQLWKVFWNSTLGLSPVPRVFSVLVPPNYSACIPSGTGSSAAGSACSQSTYRGSPIQVRQLMIPLSSYPLMSVIQLSRVEGRINLPSPYVANFCSADQPLCLGVVIRSITLMRI